MPLLALVFAGGCATLGGGRPAPADGIEYGYASYYGSEFHGRTTSSGEVYDEQGLTAAHRTLPFGTRVRITNTENGRSVVVTITDRGPFRKGRLVDVSRRAARELGFIRDGIVRVRVELVSR